MKRMFLSSSFKDVAGIFAEFAGNELTGKTVAFVPTASAVEQMTSYVSAGRKALEKLGLTIIELDISTAQADHTADVLRKCDYIYISGGNTFYLLQELKKSGADKLVTEQIERGKVYIGESAGAMIMAPNIEFAGAMDSTKKAPDLKTFEALHLIDFYPVPHHTNFPFKKAVENILAEYSPTLDLCPISNKQAILINGEETNVVTKK